MPPSGGVPGITGSLRLFLPRHVGKFLRWFGRRRRRGRFGECEFRIARRRAAGSRFIFAPRCDSSLKAVMLSGFLVARLHVEQRKVRVDELFLRLELLGLVAVGDGSGEISFAIEGHAERELRVEMRWLNREDGVQPRDGIVKLAVAESKHRVVVSFLKIFGHAPR